MRWSVRRLRPFSSEAPFDLIFIDADKSNYPTYLDWAIRPSRVGTIIVAGNVIRAGRAFPSPPPDEASAGVAEYTAKVIGDRRLLFVAFPMDDDGTDGYAISVVRTTS